QPHELCEGRPVPALPSRQKLKLNGVFVSQKLLALILFACALFVAPALAQTNVPPALPTANATALTPDQARRALETLQDDTRRAQVIDTLRAIANAQSAQPQTASSAPTPDKPSAIPLTADSLGAQLLLMVSEQVREISGEIADTARTLTHFKAF